MLVLSIAVLVLVIVATIILTLRFRNTDEFHRHPFLVLVHRKQQALPDTQHTPKLNREQYPENSLDLPSCVFHYLRQRLAKSTVLPATIDREHGDEASLTIARNRMRLRRIVSIRLRARAPFH
jgi:hypothetical protein